MRIVIEIDNDVPVAQPSAAPAAESAPAVDAGAAPTISAASTGALAASGGADVVDGGPAGGQADTTSDDTALGSIPTDAIDAGPGPQF